MRKRSIPAKVAHRNQLPPVAGNIAPSTDPGPLPPIPGELELPEEPGLLELVGPVPGGPPPPPGGGVGGGLVGGGGFEGGIAGQTVGPIATIFPLMFSFAILIKQSALPVSIELDPPVLLLALLYPEFALHKTLLLIIALL